jgi:PAS domain-containing protein
MCRKVIDAFYVTMAFLKAHPWYEEANSPRVTALAFVTIAGAATVDAIVIPPVGISYFYLVPISVAAAFLSRSQILLLTAICTLFSEAFSFSLFDIGDIGRIPRLVFIFVGYTFTALLVRNMVQYRRAAKQRVRDLETELSVLRMANADREVLLNSTSAGILTISHEGKILFCNRAAHEMFGVGPGGLYEQPIGPLLPCIEQIKAVQSRKVMQCNARRANGEEFSANVWVSKLSEAADSAIAAVIVDGPDKPQNSEHEETH